MECEIKIEEIELEEKFENNEMIGDRSCKIHFDLQEKMVSTMEEGGDPRVTNFKILRTFCSTRSGRPWIPEKEVTKIT